MSATQLIDLLVNNGVGGQNSRAALSQLDAFKQDPGFVALVCGIVKSPTCPVDPATLSSPQCDWALVRDMAAWLLKTCIRPGMAFEAMSAAAEASLAILQEQGVQRRMVSAVAVVIARLTDLNGVAWWAQNGLDLSNLLLDDMLQSQDTDRATSALRCLQYLVEDAANSIGTSISIIVERVADVAQNREDKGLRSMAIAVLAAVYEYGTELDWKVENISDVQQALCNGAGPAALASAAGLNLGIGAYDEETTCKLFRLAELLLEYLSNIAQNAGGMIDQIFNMWATSGVAGVASGMPAEVAGFACGFVGAAFDNFDNSGGDGPIAGLIGYLSNSLEPLVDSMLHNITMKAEEEEEMLATDAYNHRDPHIRRRPVKRRGAAAAGKDGAADSAGSSGGGGGNADEEESAEASLRNFACLALEAMSKTEPQRAADRVIGNVQHVFSGQESDWHRIECAICALGSIYTGSQQQLNGFLPNLIPLIGQAVGTGEPDTQHHIATISISLWALSKFSEWAMSADQGTFNAMVQCAMPCLTSSSKRVQYAAITFFRNTLYGCMLLDPQGAGPMGQHLGTLVEKINVCLPVYHTRNLRVLCTVVKFLVPMMGQNAGSMIEAFSGQLQTRLPALQQSMAQRYQHHDVRVQPDCDCFEVGSVTATIYAALDLSPAIAQNATGEASTWIEVMKFALQCEAQHDDTTPFYSSLQNLSLLLPAVDDQSLMTLLGSNGNEFVRLAMHVAGAVDDSGVKSSACDVIYYLIQRFGVEVLPNGVDETVAMLSTFGTVAEDCSLIADSSLLLCKLFEAMPPAATPNAQRYAAALAEQVRGDAVDNDAMGLLAQCVGTLMAAAPQNFSVRAASETAMALRRCDNDQYKADATYGIMSVLSAHAINNPNDHALGDAVASFIRLTLSWQSDSVNFEGLAQAMVGFFENAKQQPLMCQALQGTINDRMMPPSGLKIMKKYGF